MTGIGKLERSDEGDLIWSTTTKPAIAVTIAEPHWPVVTVDATSPQTLVGLVLAPEKHHSKFLDMLEKPVHLDATTTNAGALEGLQQADLRAEWIRVAVVEAVDQHMPYSLDEHALAVDRAMAWIDAGARDRGQDLLRWADAWLRETGERVASTKLPGAVATEIIRAIRYAARLFSGDIREPFADLLGRIHMARATHLPRAAAALQRVVPRQPAMLGTHRSPTLTMLTGFVDPLLVPPRVIAWRGAREPELSGIYVEESTTVTVALTLAPGTLATDSEARSLVAWAALRNSGAPWSSVLLQSDRDGRTVTGELPVFNRNPADLVFGITDIENAASVRSDRTGLLEAQVDRMVLDAWAIDRLALAAMTLATPRGATHLAWPRLEALSLLKSADEVQRRLLHELAQNAPTEIMVAAEERLSRIASYRRDLERPSRNIPSAQRPLLAELLLVSDGPVSSD